MAAQTIKINIYSKPRCSQCVVMRDTLESWVKDTGKSVDVLELSAIEYIDYLTDQGHMSAPVYEIERNGEMSYVSGLQPDVLVDILDGNESIWDFADDE